MVARCLKIFLILLLLFSVSNFSVFAAPCGNGQCQPSQGEDCNSCPADCGACPTPPPTPTPTPVPSASPTPTPEPGTTPAPTSPPSSEGQSNQPAPTTTPKPTTPPKISLSKLESPTKNTNPIISGTLVKTESDISKVEISMDGGGSWFPASFTASAFKFIPHKLEDGNYVVSARAQDVFGNIAITPSQTMVIDSLPPTMGGAIFSLGPLVLSPDQNGVIGITPGASIKVVVSTKGGTTEAFLQSGDSSFPLEEIRGTNLWSGIISFSEAGEKSLKIRALDGAGNETQREYAKVSVVSPGLIKEGNGNPIQNAKITLYAYDESFKNWVVFDTATFGQTNPQTVSENGNYSFMLPKGKYYFDISAPGYQNSQSRIFEVSSLSLINYEFTLDKANMFLLGLPQLLELKERETTEIQTSNPLIGKDMPTSDLLASFRGKKLHLVFLSAWQPRTPTQAAVLNPHDVVVFVQDSKTSVDTFMRRGGYTFNAVSDESGALSVNFGIGLMPQHFFIDSKGIVQDAYTGVLNNDQILAKMNKLQ